MHILPESPEDGNPLVKQPIRAARLSPDSVKFLQGGDDCGLASFPQQAARRSRKCCVCRRVEGKWAPLPVPSAREDEYEIRAFPMVRQRRVRVFLCVQALGLLGGITYRYIHTSVYTVDRCIYKSKEICGRRSQTMIPYNSFKAMQPSAADISPSPSFKQLQSFSSIRNFMLHHLLNN